MIRKKKSSFSFFSKTVWVINIIAACMLLFSYLAPFTDPHTFWPISFFGLAYPGLLFINVLFVVYWLFRPPKFAVLSVIAILIGFKFIASYIGFRETTAIGVPKSSENFIRIMTYNVHNFKQYGSKNDDFTKDQILDIIRQEQPDVICFQEFFYRIKGEYNFKKLIQEIMHSSNYYFEPVSDNGYEANGMAIFSKFPIVIKDILALMHHVGTRLYSQILNVIKKHSEFTMFIFNPSISSRKIINT